MDTRAKYNRRNKFNLKKMRYCRYHMTTGCRKSDAHCRFIHNTNIIIPCPYQHCSKGRVCWYKHDDSHTVGNNNNTLENVLGELLDSRLKTMEEKIVSRIILEIKKPAKDDIDRAYSTSSEEVPCTEEVKETNNSKGKPKVKSMDISSPSQPVHQLTETQVQVTESQNEEVTGEGDLVNGSVQNSRMNEEESQNGNITGEDSVQATSNVEGMDISSSSTQPKVKESQNQNGKVSGVVDLVNSRDHLEEDIKMDSSQVPSSVSDPKVEIMRDCHGLSYSVCHAFPCNGRIDLRPRRYQPYWSQPYYCGYCKAKIDKNNAGYWEHIFKDMWALKDLGIDCSSLNLDWYEDHHYVCQNCIPLSDTWK